MRPHIVSQRGAAINSQVDFKVRISEAALGDLEEILAYSWENFPDTAGRFGNGLNHVKRPDARLVYEATANAIRADP